MGGLAAAADGDAAAQTSPLREKAKPNE